MLEEETFKKNISLWIFATFSSFFLSSFLPFFYLNELCCNVMEKWLSSKK